MLLYVLLECNSGKQDKCMYLLSILWLKVGNVVIQTSIFTNKSWTFMIVYKNDTCICNMYIGKKEQHHLPDMVKRKE